VNATPRSATRKDEPWCEFHKARNLPPSYRFICVSRFGYLGSSLPPKATVRMQAAAYEKLLDHLRIDRVFLVGNSAGGPSAMWFSIGYPERTQGLILLSSAVPGRVPDPIPPLVATHDFVYWAAVKAAPGSLLGMLMPKSVIQSMSKEDKADAVELSLLASMPISQRTEGIRFDNQVTVPGINDVPFEQVTRPTLIFQAVEIHVRTQEAKRWQSGSQTPGSSDSPGGTCCSDTRPRFERRLPTLSRRTPADRGDPTCAWGTMPLLHYARSSQR
jgi:pimeloyl-ACP methyl ester carboxylesterase